MVQVNTWG